MSRLILTMIVKNEAPVLERCFASVRPIVQAACIVDTGSTDGTQAIARAFVEELGAGDVYERPWVDFAHNRTEAFDLSRGFGDYHLVIDADDRLELAPDFVLPELTEPVYRLRIQDAGLTYFRAHLFRTDIAFSYRFVLHEAAHAPAPFDRCINEGPVLEGITYVRSHDGARARDPKTYRKDAEILRRALARETDPFTRNRYAFYLAQSLKDAGDLEKARHAYETRARMHGGWDEETWMAHYEAARLRKHLHPTHEGEIVREFLHTFDQRPVRIEPLYELAHYYRAILDRPSRAFVYARAAADAPVPNDRLFLDRSIYDWRSLYELAITAWYGGQRELAREAHRKLLAISTFPEELRIFIRANLERFWPGESE